MVGIIIKYQKEKNISRWKRYKIVSNYKRGIKTIYDKPMIYYPLSVLMLAGCAYNNKVLGDGSDIGMKFSYVIQPSPDGLAQAFLLGEEFLDA